VPKGVTAGTGYAKTFDPFVAMTAAAAATTTLKVATGLSGAAAGSPLRREEVATVDVLSDGRVILGVEAGWNRQECATTAPTRRPGCGC
jgi:alkanesulfonate monooxygenase SsuD/methylene tetrahydromethanopterin reductase-like flavin-dependent oxidoreductase (luciferase family)